jgi:D-serine deaminase-like pyridoxal phosphate-dependent protein
VFADNGFEDITWAFPVILNRLEEALAIAGRTTLRLVVDSPEAVRALDETGHPFRVWLEVDCGDHRSGVDPGSERSVDLARAVHQSETLLFDGLLTHSGHAYRTVSPRETARVAAEERDVMSSLAASLSAAGIDCPGISVGSTPAMSVVDHLDGITEARPGNYAFFDFTQVSLGSCLVRDCAVTVLSSVVSSRSGGDHSVIDAGALALSKDAGRGDLERPTMGEIYDEYESGTLREDARVATVSQEHGEVSASLPIGSRVRILPNHSCLTVACFDEFHVLRGDDVIDTWKIWRGR